MPELSIIVQLIEAFGICRPARVVYRRASEIQTGEIHPNAFPQHDKTAAGLEFLLFTQSFLFFKGDHCMNDSHPGSARRLWKTLRLLLAVSIVSSGLVAIPVLAEGVHVVGYGEYLSGIAVQYGVSVGELIAANGIGNPNIITPGTRLVIPGEGGGGTTSSYSAPTASAAAAGGYYTVQRGDSLSSVAQNYGMSMDDLMRLNGIGNANFIWVGQQLRLSARVSPGVVPSEQQPSAQLAGSAYVVRPGDTLSQIAANYGTTTQALLAANGLPNANFVWVGQRLRIAGAGAPTQQIQAGVSEMGSGNRGAKWIEVNLSNQTLIAWEGDVAVMSSVVSTGLGGTPTVTGRFAVYNKLSSQHMSGPGYSLPGVPSVMYFFSGYAIHGAYWHNNFGNPMSHGCVNMNLPDAAVLYNWAPMGTEVYVHY